MEFLDHILIQIGGSDITVRNVIDLSLVSFLIYRLYKLAKGTPAIHIFLGLTAIYIIYFTVSILELKYLSQLLGAFVGGGVIIIIILFQQEIRKYLSLIGNRNIIKNSQMSKMFNSNKQEKLDISIIIDTCIKLSNSKTGAIIVLTKEDEMINITNTGVKIDSEISYPIIKSIFFKNSPLHDGALIIRHNRIVAARCILPISNDVKIPGELGMRHRAAFGLSEQSDAITIIISEENGKISYTENQTLKIDINKQNLIGILSNYDK